jgi:hypothetical protein
VSKRVSSTVTKRKANPRPRKYASASERQAAYRDRAPEVCFRAEPQTVETLDRIADTIDRSRAELLLSMTKFALTNHDWARFGLTHKPLPFGYGTQDETREENPTMLHEFARIGKPFNYDGRTWKVTAYDHTGETIEAATTDRKSPYRRERINVSELMTTRRPLKKNPAAKRTPTPAQLAARERFAEAARSGAFKKAGASRRKANPVGNLANLKKRYQTLLLTMADLRDDMKRRKKGLPDDEFMQGYSDAEVSALLTKYQTKAQDLREAIAMYEGQRKANPAPRSQTFYIHANLGYGKTAHFKVTTSPGANSVRSAANQVANHLGYPVFVGSRNESPRDGYPVVRFEFIDDAQTKSVDLFAYQVKREGVKYSTIRQTNPAKPAATRKGNPADEYTYSVDMEGVGKSGLFMTKAVFKTAQDAKQYARALAKSYPSRTIRVMSGGRWIKR